MIRTDLDQNDFDAMIIGRLIYRREKLGGPLLGEQLKLYHLNLTKEMKLLSEVSSLRGLGGA